MVAAPNHVADASVGRWINERLGLFGSVGGLVPLGFDSYLRVRHRDAADEDPVDGLSREALLALCEVIASGSPVNECFFAVWEGHGWVNGGSRVILAARGEAPAPELVAAARTAGAAPAFSPEIINGDRLRLPQRSYLLFEGPFASALAIGRHEQILDQKSFEPYAPDLIWPRDHSWFVATDTDLWFAYVGASSALARQIEAEERLGSMLVSPHRTFAELEPH